MPGCLPHGGGAHHCGNAWPAVAARSVPVKPKDSTTGRYACRNVSGVRRRGTRIHALCKFPTCNIGRHNTRQRQQRSTESLYVHRAPVGPEGPSGHTQSPSRLPPGGTEAQAAAAVHLQVEDGGAGALRLLEHQAALLVEHRVHAAQRLLGALRKHTTRWCQPLCVRSQPLSSAVHRRHAHGSAPVSQDGQTRDGLAGSNRQEGPQCGICKFQDLGGERTWISTRYTGSHRRGCEASTVAYSARRQVGMIWPPPRWIASACSTTSLICSGPQRPFCTRNGQGAEVSTASAHLMWCSVRL